tara:strand:- start:132 stop:518 length:387 start_codon:yes stop_codon:yes gene_type:complete
MNEAFLTFVKFSCTGLIGVILNFSLTFLMKEKFSVNRYVSNSVSLFCALALNYFLNRVWTFQSNNDIFYEVLIFVGVIFIGLMMNHLLVYFFHQRKKVNFYFSKVLAVIIIFTWNLIMHSQYTFNTTF